MNYYPANGKKEAAFDDKNYFVCKETRNFFYVYFT